MENLYPYTLDKHQNKPKPYHFIEYGGKDIITEFKESRAAALKYFDDTESKQYTLFRLSNSDKTAMEKFNTGEKVETKQLLEELCYYLFSGEDMAEYRDMFEELRRMSELRKLKNSYGGKFGGSGADVETYVFLANALSLHHETTGDLQSLSTLLKTNDRIISMKEDLNKERRYLAARAIEQESSHLRKIYASLENRPLGDRLNPIESSKPSLEKIQRLGLLAQDSPRSRAYIQTLAQNGLLPERAIILSKDVEDYGLGEVVENPFFDTHEKLTETISYYDIPYQMVQANNFNDQKVVDAVKDSDGDYFVFSGSGILRKDILSTGKKLIHIHPGKLPEFRGSTVIYYTLLSGNVCTASAFVISDKIDMGEVITSKEFLPPTPDMDNGRVYDPYIRANVLVDVIRELRDKGKLETYTQNKGGQTYYIIHPILRTLTDAYVRDEIQSLEDIV